jgi:hypothetical protein
MVLPGLLLNCLLQALNLPLKDLLANLPRHLLTLLSRINKALLPPNLLTSLPRHLLTLLSRVIRALLSDLPNQILCLPNLLLVALPSRLMDLLNPFTMVRQLAALS